MKGYIPQEKICKSDPGVKLMKRRLASARRHQAKIFPFPFEVKMFWDQTVSWRLDDWSLL